jgi:hypothetical protein
MAMMAMTTSSSISVNADRQRARRDNMVDTPWSKKEG